MLSPSWLVQQVVPPALLLYFGRTLQLCVTEIGPKYIGQQLGRPILGRVYSLAAWTLIPSVSLLFLRLYFLPARQSVPPLYPPDATKPGIYECLSPAETTALRLAAGAAGEASEDDSQDNPSRPLFNRCWKGRCRGRWKPARARHCSECGVCRAGFDHHCAFFANCLTAPYIPTFLCLLTLTPLSILLLSSPLYPSLASRTIEAYRRSGTDELIRQGWYGWKWSWIIAGGPVGRFVVGVVLGWKALDREDGVGLSSTGNTFRLEIGILVGIGIVLALITAALGLKTASLVRQGHLTVDRERARSLARASAVVQALVKAGKSVPKEALDNLDRWTDRHYFWVVGPPFPTTTIGEEGNQDGDTAAATVTGDEDAGGGSGRVVALSPDIQPYDHGPKTNWELIMGKGWGWILPWQAVRRGMSSEAILNWPLAEGVERIIRATS